MTGSSPAPSSWPRRLARLAPVAALVVLALVAWRTGLLAELTPQALGRREGELRMLAGQTPGLALAVYIAVYAVATGACLPVALMLTLTGGIVFGGWLGGAATVLGASSGAVLTYLASRAAFAPSLVRRAQGDARLEKLIAGFGENAFAYILTLRLIPFFPFSLVNIAAGLAAAPLRAFTLATLVGCVPTSLIYASLGAGLGDSIRSPDALHSALHAPAVLLPLAGLALLSAVPLAIKAARSRRGAA